MAERLNVVVLRALDVFLRKKKTEGLASDYLMIVKFWDLPASQRTSHRACEYPQGSTHDFIGLLSGIWITLGAIFGGIAATIAVSWEGHAPYDELAATVCAFATATSLGMAVQYGVRKGVLPRKSAQGPQVSDRSLVGTTLLFFVPLLLILTR